MLRKVTAPIIVGIALLLGAVAFVASPATLSANADPNPTTTTIATGGPKLPPSVIAAIEAKKKADIARYIAAVKAHERKVYIDAVNWSRFVAHIRAERAREAARRAAAAAYPHGLCGGDLPPCYVMMRESRGIITARNPHSSASGKWQFIRSTWAGFGGYSDAYLAPEKVQDAKARLLWNHGRGCGHWSAC